MPATLLRRYADRLPDSIVDANEDAPLSLGEGDTPLLPLLNLDIPHGIRIFVKYEGLNPTGSFKDRGMVAAIAAAKKGGAKCVICASTGNTSAAAAAYAGRVNLPCIVLLPEGKVAAGKIAQALAHGALLTQIDGNFDDAMRTVRGFSDNGDVAVVNSINPMRLQGQKTAAFEIIEQLGGAPDYHALPVGNAGNITAHWLGYSEAAGDNTTACNFCGGDCPYLCKKESGKRPIMLGYQAAGAAPFLAGAPVDAPETVATAIRIGNPQSFDAAKAVMAESNGWFAAIADEDILKTQKLLAAKEGIFCEPASATSVAGVLADIRQQKIPKLSTVVCTLTGHGLKDPDIFPAPDIRAVKVKDLHALISDTISSLNR